MAKSTVSRPASRCTSGGREVPGTGEVTGILTRAPARWRSSFSMDSARRCLRRNLESVIRAGQGALQLGDQLAAIDQEGLAGLVASEVMHQGNGAAAAHVEEPLEPGAVEYREGKRPHLLPGCREAAETKRVWRARRMNPSALC